MTNLSPAARAILDAYANRAKRDLHGRWVEPAIAAALRALADEVVPVEPYYENCDVVREEILEIAAELENNNAQ